MKKALIICAAGMSSSLMAKKTTEFLNSKGCEVEIDAISATEGAQMIESSDFDLFLISPQTKMHYAKFAEIGEKVNKPVINIPPQAYIPVPTGIQKMAKLVVETLKK